MSHTVTDTQADVPELAVKVGPSCYTCADEQHVVGLPCHVHPVDGDLRVADVAFQQQRLAADHAVHQEVVFDKVQHLVRHLQGGGDALLSGCIGDALEKQQKVERC